MEASLLNICMYAFLTVMGILAFLAYVIHLLTVYFPETQIKTDTTLIAAISSVVATVFPGARVTDIREITSIDSHH